jgi:cell division septation protein DedD
MVAAACGGSEGLVPPRPTGAGWSGPDAVLVRIPTEGGLARAYRWGEDSVLWTSAQPVPRARDLIAFDADEGTVTILDARGVPMRVELRLGTVAAAAGTPMERVASADGWAVYGVNAKREVERMTPAGNWTYRSALTPRALLPQPDGSLVLLNDIGARSVLRRIVPPESRIVDTVSVPQAVFAVGTAIGDRIYFGTDSGLAGVRVRDLSRTRTVQVSGTPADAVPTPSGDRIFVALAGEASLALIDRYDERVVGHIRLVAPAMTLRMDPDGRYLLARHADDSISVVSVAESRVVTRLASRWRGDLPLVGPDGAILTLDSTDAVEIEPVSGRVRRRYAGGASDLWALIRWNGFRPRAKGLDTPVSFDADSTDSLAVAADSAAAPRAPAAAAAPSLAAPRDVPREAPADATEPRGRGGGWTLSFAALLDEQRARTLAGSIRVEGRPIRIVATQRDGATIWRVVCGPFATREDAERAGRRTGLPYWVYEDTP